MNKLRIQKLLAERGVASRRAVEEMIVDGRVSVNGKLVTQLPFFVEETDDIRIDGRRVAAQPSRKIYILLNKPRGVVCTQKDSQGRPVATDLVPNLPSRVYCVGGLDVDSTGLVLLTNDGELTRLLTNPRRPLERLYVLEIDGQLNEEQMGQLKAGVFLEGHRTPRAAVRVLGHERNHSVLEVRVRESRNLDLRHVLAKLGHKVRRLKRVGFGPLTDKGIKIGHFRSLQPAEAAGLRGGA